MRPFLTLTLAVVASASCIAQTGSPRGDSGKPVKAEPGNLAPADSAARADSLLHLQLRIVPFPDAINAVLGDLPYNLRHLTGELLLAEGEVDHYASLVSVPEAEKCLVMRYHSVVDTTASWQARMFSGGDFAEAARKYRQLYGMLQTCYLRLPDSSVYFLVGNWEPAREEVGFTTSTLHLRTDDERYKDVKVELDLLYQVTDWTINIDIITKRDDDAVGMRGKKGND